MTAGVHVNAGPVFDADHALVHQHAEAIEGLAAARFGILDQVGAGRIGDDVGHHQSLAQAIQRDIKPRIHIGVEANGGCVDHDVGACRDCIGAFPDGEFGFHLCLAVEEINQGLPAFGIAVYNRDVLCAGERQFHADGAGGTAGAEHHDGFSGGIDEFAERLEEALAVGVFADQLCRRAPRRSSRRP